MLVFLGRTIWLRRKGTKVIVLGSGKKGFTALLEKSFLVFFSIWLIEIGIHSLHLNIQFLPLVLVKLIFKNQIIQFAGAAVIFVSLVFFCLALISFNSSWRVGIDTAAHRGALKAGGKTLAVLGSGLRMVYPRENCQLADNICSSGTILSECHPNEVVSSQRLIQRNRIISGLSLGAILVEPGGGALNTAERALEHGRPVFIYDPESVKELSQSLSEKIFPIRGVDEMDIVAEQLRTAKTSIAVKNGGGQMRLL